MTVRVLEGDCREVLTTLPGESVHCVVTSPPYFGLRDYGMTGQIGLEESPNAFVDQMVDVFQAVRRVLRADGTIWLNLGDSYAGSNMTGGTGSKEHGRRADRMIANRNKGKVHAGLKSKDLIGVPWRVALALQEAGWWLRQDIIWHKPNPMPESILDRCTKAHEYIFLLAKSERYYYNADAIAEDAVTDDGLGILRSQKVRAYAMGRTPSGNEARARGAVPVAHAANARERKGCPNDVEGNTRNKRSVWTVTTQPFGEAHFATFPPALIEPCILAGCPEGGTVLDPFGGAGTTGLVADRHKRNAILIELNPEYAEMARKRIYNDAPLFADVA